MTFFYEQIIRFIGRDSSRKCTRPKTIFMYRIFQDCDIVPLIVYFGDDCDVCVC